MAVLKEEKEETERQKRGAEGRWNGCPQMTDISDSYLEIMLSHSDLVVA